MFVKNFAYNFNKFFFRKCTTDSPTGNVSLIGRDLISLQSFTSCEIKKFLWTALNLKCSPVVKSSPKVTLLLNTPNIKTQAVAGSAVDLINGNLTTIIDPTWEKAVCIDDTGKMLSLYSDLIVCQADQHLSVERLADGATVPVVNIESSQSQPLTVLSDLVTLQERYGHLKRLVLAYIGPPSPLLNTYMIALPKVGMDLRYCCKDGSETAVSPSMAEVNVKLCQKYETETHECLNLEDVAYQATAIATTNHSNDKLMIKLDNLKKAAVDWSFLHNLPRSCCEVEKKVFEHEFSLVWDSCQNLKFTYAAVMLLLSHNYKHTIAQPCFDNLSHEYV